MWFMRIVSSRFYCVQTFGYICKILKRCGYKPSSVFSNYLSRRHFAMQLKRIAHMRDINLLFLLRIGFTWHSLLPKNRWALTPPFHPYHKRGGIFLLHFPLGCPSHLLNGILSLVAQTFLFFKQLLATPHEIIAKK